MNVRITLIALTMSNAELKLVLPAGISELPSTKMENGDPDTQATKLAMGLSGKMERIQRHGFLSPNEAKSSALTLLYTQLLPEEKLQGEIYDRINVKPVKAVREVLNISEAAIVQRVVGDLKSDLDQVMQSRLNKRGLAHLLDLLPDIFDHKELAAAYYSLTGEKPSSPLMLARMMLDRYTMGSGDKKREVKGRDLIREYEGGKPELFGQKWDKNKDLYRTGGPKTKRLYKKNLSE